LLLQNSSLVPAVTASPEEKIYEYVDYEYEWFNIYSLRNSAGYHNYLTPRVVTLNNYTACQKEFKLK